MDKTSVIHFLRIQEVQLENQLKALRQTISLIDGAEQAPTVNMPYSTPKATADANVEDTKAQEQKPAKPKNSLVGKKEMNGRKVRPVKLPKAYDPKLSYTRKLAYLISENGPQTSQELIKRVQALEPNEDKDKIARSVTITASAMYRKGLVQAERRGRAYVYSV